MRLTLSSNFILVLEITFYVSSLSRNLISISRLVPLGFLLLFKTMYLNYFINQIILDHVF